MDIRVRLRAHGHVQGVSFRYHTRQRAAALGLSGWVRNRPDGTVEAEAQGPRDAVDALTAWMREGPAGAEVRRLEVESIPTEDGQTFRIVA
jgi:acylphosphatase